MHYTLKLINLILLKIKLIIKIDENFQIEKSYLEFNY